MIDSIHRFYVDYCRIARLVCWYMDAKIGHATIEHEELGWSWFVLYKLSLYICMLLDVGVYCQAVWWGGTKDILLFSFHSSCAAMVQPMNRYPCPLTSAAILCSPLLAQYV